MKCNGEWPSMLYVGVSVFVVYFVSLCYILLTAVGFTPGGRSTVQYSTVQYTLTHEPYTEQHNETEYTKYFIHNNKNT
jgi:hypothetical protein